MLRGRRRQFAGGLVVAFLSVLPLARGADLTFTPVAPCRLVDTRAGGGPLAPRAARLFSATDATAIAAAGGSASGCAVPTDLTALMLTLTAVLPAQAGNLIAYPADGAIPVASSLSFVAGQIIANTTLTVSTPGTGSTFALFNNSDGTTDVVVDAGGYFREATSPDCARASSSASVTSGQQALAASTCATGYAAVGGGCFATGTVTWLERLPSSAGEGYRCRALGLDATSVTITADAMCCRVAGRAASSPGANQAPTVSAGTATTITLPATASLAGSANDDGLPSPPSHLTLGWSKLTGPGNVAFANATAATTTASFTQAGAYVLRLSASDGALTSTSDVAITVNAPLVAQTVDFAPIADRALAASPFTVSASASSGLPVAFTTPTPSVCTTSAATVTLVTAGTCTIVATQSGNAQYAPAQASRTFQVTATGRSPQTITGFAPTSSVTYTPGASLALIANGGASGNPVVFASRTSAVCTVSGTTANLLGPGACTLTADQAGNASYDPAPQVVANVTIRIPTAGAPTLVTPSLPVAQPGQPYNARVVIGTSSPLAFVQVSGLPVNLAAADNGAGGITFSGAVAAPGTYPLTITARNAAGDATLSLTLKVDAIATNVGAISSSNKYTCALVNGGVRCWGVNNSVSPTFGSATPVFVIPEGSGATAVAAASSHACAVVNGGVMCWGLNNAGQLGNGTTVNSMLPVVAIPAGSSVTAVAANAIQSCALANGGVRCWGFLGIPPSATSHSLHLTPVIALAAGSGVTSLVVGFTHVCVVINGGVKCWGSNQLGQLGNGTSTDANAPVDTIPAGSGVTDLIAGDGHNCAIVAASLKCWGANRLGQLAIAGADVVLVPTTVEVGGPVTAVATTGTDYGQYSTHTCVIVNGGVRCFGYNVYGQLGADHNLPFPRGTQVQAVPEGSGATAVAAGKLHTCVRINGSVQCWGDAGSSELGAPTPETSLVPSAVALPGTQATALAPGNGSMCAIIGAGGVSCWGRFTRVTAVPPGNSDGLRLAEFVPLGGGVTAISQSAYGDAGPPPALCVAQNGGVACFGLAGEPRVERLPANSGVSALSSTTYAATCFGSSCARVNACAAVAGGMKCWNNDTSDATLAVIAPGSGVASIALGDEGSGCALVSDGVMCWGNTTGVAGTPYSTAPIWTIAAGSRATAVSSRSGHICAVIDGGLKCWGQNAYGQLGTGTTTNALTPVSVFPAGSGVTGVTNGYYHTCAVVNGGVRCWGYNGQGALGNGGTTQSLTPVVTIPDGSNVTAIAADFGHTCAIVNGGVVCWGLAGEGETGDPALFGTTDLASRGYLPFGYSVHRVFAALTPSTVAGAPIIGTPVAGPGSATLPITPPSSDGGSLIVSYVATCTAAGHTTQTATASVPATSVTVTGLDPGVAYTCSAAATNGLGTGASSASVTVTPTVNASTTVSMTAPASGASFVTPATVTLSATAVPATNRTITQVEFLQNGTPIGIVTAPPYTMLWNMVASGSYAITARATDNANMVVTSAAVTITGSVAGEMIVYLHHDLAGSPIVATDAGGAVLWKEGYEPYGNRTHNEAASSANRQFFTGKPFDADTGLAYFGARYYDPIVGRFMGVDPKGFDEANLHSFNRYAYANDNPYRFVDPDGRSPLDIGFLAVDVGRLGFAIYSGAGIGTALVNVGISVVGVVSPIPGTGLAVKALRTASTVAVAIQSSAKPDEAEKKDEAKASADGKRARRPTAETQRGADAAAKGENGEIHCQYCGEATRSEPGHGNSREYDHYDAHSKGGGNGPGNIVVSCRTCNRGKGAKIFPEQWVPGQK